MTLFAAGIMAVIDLYLGWRLTKALACLTGRARPVWTRLTILLFLIFYALPVTGLLHFMFGGNVDIFSYPWPIMYLFWFGFVFSFQVLTWFMIMDLLKISVNLGAGMDHPLLNRIYGFIIITVSVITLLYSGLKLNRDTGLITVDKTVKEVTGLPETLEGFRVVHISDIQADSYTGPEKIDRYINKINELEPDIVIFTGDLISYGTDYVKMAAQKLSGIDVERGVYAVIGDHDYWAGSHNIIEALESHGIPVLDGDNAWIKTEGGRIRLTGVTHVYSRSAPESEIEWVTRDTLDSPVKIFAAHQVSDPILTRAESKDYDLLLAGHTHGGQVRIPYMFQTFSASGFETDYVQGQYRRGALLINVNSGLGFTLAPVRYNAPAEITLIELIKASD